ncbi:hypothetical protein KAU18_07915 [Candidatus Bathyarchaeota archaeon]|jgi:hypothetical protein|nr:hypothetical protein [Candidatus Bathyarchaeota archaeon]
MRSRGWIRTAFLAIMVIGLTLSFSVHAQLFKDRFPGLKPDIEPEDLPRIRELMGRYFLGKTVISSINAVLLLYLSLVYYRVYRATRSQFSLGLMIMSVAFFLFVVSSSPVMNWLIGGRQLLGVFNFVGDLFTTIAAVVLIYLSRQ